MSNFKENMNEKKEGMSSSFQSGVKKTQRFFKRLFRTIIIILIFGGGAYLLWCNYTYSSGTRSGYLIKISEKGYIFKTCEGQLNLGGVEASPESGITGNVWNFSVKNNGVHQEAKNRRPKSYTSL